MIEIPINSIDAKYKDLAKVLINDDIPESLTLDTYNEFPMDVGCVDYGYIKLNGGVTEQMFVASSRANDLKRTTIYLSKDGLVWLPIDLPKECITQLYNKLVIYNGDVYLLYDDIVLRLYDFDIITSGLMIDSIQDDVYDIMVNKHTLCMLTHNGVYKITNDPENKEFVEVTAEIVFDSFVKSLNGDLIILGYAGGYPVFVLQDDTSHLIFCTTKCQLRTAISYKDKILCYTTDSRVIDVYKSYEMFGNKETVYAGYNWSGTVTYHHSHFWLAYTEFENDVMIYTVIAKSSDGINFDPEVRLPHVSEKDGVSCWGNSYTYCVCCGNMFTLKCSEKYSDYGFPFIKHYKDIPIGEDGTVEIDADMIISDFDRYVFSPYLCGESQMKRNTSIRYEVIPHFENEKICFKLEERDYTGLHINAYFYGVLIIY